MRLKKGLLVGIALLVVLMVGGMAFVVLRNKRPKKPPITSQPQQKGVIETPLEERPYVSLTPRVDGKEFTLDIRRIKNAQTIEYELVYLSNGLSRGVIGSVELKGEDHISRKLLLGTCSRNVCKYDEGVEEGTLTLRFRNPEGIRKFTADFHLQQGGEELTSGDGKFKLKGRLSPTTFYLTMSTIGLPEDVEGKVIGGPYGVFTSGKKTVEGIVSLSLGEKTGGARLYSWDGASWKEETKKVKMLEERISASIDNLATFVGITPVKD